MLVFSLAGLGQYDTHVQADHVLHTFGNGNAITPTNQWPDSIFALRIED